MIDFRLSAPAGVPVDEPEPEGSGIGPPLTLGVGRRILKELCVLFYHKEMVLLFAPSVKLGLTTWQGTCASTEEIDEQLDRLLDIAEATRSTCPYPVLVWAVPRKSVAQAIQAIHRFVEHPGERVLWNWLVDVGVVMVTVLDNTIDVGGHCDIVKDVESWLRSLAEASRIQTTWV